MLTLTWVWQVPVLGSSEAAHAVVPEAYRGVTALISLSSMTEKLFAGTPPKVTEVIGACAKPAP